MTGRGFASDNNAAVHPLIMAAMENANSGHAIAYGDDPLTIRVTDKMKKIFGENSAVFFVYNGTAANVLGLSSVTQSYNAVITPETAHIHVDECGAAEKFTGCKLLTVSTPDGKLTVDQIKQHMHGIGFEHHVQPKVVSITQATELGTVYTIEEIKKITDYAHSQNMYVHMDGARISNAVAALNSDLYSLTGGAGIDMLSFGGTKNGLMFGEAVVFFSKELAEDFKYRRKQGMQLTSKMRYISAQFEAFLENDLWLKNARHANRMAGILYEAVRQIKGVQVTRKVDANAVFAVIPKSVAEELRKSFFFYDWDEESGEVRWMCSWDTTEDDILRFSELLKKLME